MSGKRRVLVTLLVTGAVLAIGGGAYAATISSPVDSNGVIHSCYTTAAVKGSHAIVLQDTTTACPNGTTALNWNQTGATGPQGPAGSQGPTGPQGPAGPAGTANITVQSDTEQGSAEATCPDGTTVVSGGAVDNTGAALSADGPELLRAGNNLPSLDGWIGQTVDPTDTVTAYVLCAQ
jgi:hypothetical protein